MSKIEAMGGLKRPEPKRLAPLPEEAPIAPLSLPNVSRLRTEREMALMMKRLRRNVPQGEGIIGENTPMPEVIDFSDRPQPGRLNLNPLHAS